MSLEGSSSSKTPKESLEEKEKKEFLIKFNTLKTNKDSPKNPLKRVQKTDSVKDSLNDVFGPRASVILTLTMPKRPG
jgi:hypothetical protein